MNDDGDGGRTFALHDLQGSSDLPDCTMTLDFEALETDPRTCIKNLYKDLDLTGHDKSKAYFEAYLNKMKSYQKNKHHITEALMEKIQTEWGFAMKEWGYGIPKHIKIEANE